MTVPQTLQQKMAQKRQEAGRVTFLASEVTPPANAEELPLLIHLVEMALDPQLVVACNVEWSQTCIHFRGPPERVPELRRTLRAVVEGGAWRKQAAEVKHAVAVLQAEPEAGRPGYFLFFHEGELFSAPFYHMAVLGHSLLQGQDISEMVPLWATRC